VSSSGANGVRVAVAGGTGVVGRHVVDALRERGRVVPVRPPGAVGRTMATGSLLPVPGPAGRARPSRSGGQEWLTSTNG